MKVGYAGAGRDGGVLVRVREAGVMGSAYLRHSFLEDISYPITVALREIGVVFPVFMYMFIARLVPGRAAGGSAAVGGDYFTFAVVGLATAAVLQAALAGFGNKLQTAQDNGTFETLLVEPVPWPFIPFAMNLYKIMLGGVACTLMLFVAVLFGADIRMAGLPAYILILALGVVATMAVGIIAASLLVLAKRTTAILTLYGYAASLLGGALFPIQELPSFLRGLSFLVPHAYVISVSRATIMNDAPVAYFSATSAILGLAGFSILALPLGLFLFSRSLQYARRMGLLGGY